jgi:ligand-binding sensor domain-containing protein
VRHVLDAEELSHGVVPRALCVSGTGEVWIGTSGGLFVFTHDAGPTLVRGDLTGADVRALMSGPQDARNMFVGTARGLYHGAGEDWLPVDQLGDVEITALAVGRRGRPLWVGTAGGLVGLVRDHDGWAPAYRFDCATSGLAGDRVSALAVDGRGRLWAGSPSGLSSYDPGDEGKEAQ